MVKSSETKIISHLLGFLFFFLEVWTGSLDSWGNTQTPSPVNGTEFYYVGQLFVGPKPCMFKFMWVHLNNVTSSKEHLKQIYLSFDFVSRSEIQI